MCKRSSGCQMNIIQNLHATKTKSIGSYNITDYGYYILHRSFCDTALRCFIFISSDLFNGIPHSPHSFNKTSGFLADLSFSLSIFQYEPSPYYCYRGIFLFQTASNNSSEDTTFPWWSQRYHRIENSYWVSCNSFQTNCIYGCFCLLTDPLISYSMFSRASFVYGLIIAYITP